MFLSKHYNQQPKITNMKKIILFVLMVFTISTYSQMKKNGTIYVDHPAINAVLSMNKAYNDGDIDKYASYLTDDFREIDGLISNKNDKGATKEELLSEIRWLRENTSYSSETLAQGTYPIALQIKDGDNNDVVRVEIREQMKLVYNETGVKIDEPINRLFFVNKENKIEKIIYYFDKTSVSEHRSSYSETENGIIYNHHKYINKVRNMVHAFEFHDYDKAYGFFRENATFRDINMPIGKFLSIEENKEYDKKFKEEFSVNSIDARGAPVYIHYEIGDKKVVQSYWNFSLTRKSDGKNIVLPVRYFHYFDEGLIIYTLTYYSTKLLED